MQKYIIKFGLISGSIAILSIIAGQVFEVIPDTQFWGYLSMLIALSAIFVAIKRYRDHELGGVIRFGQALAMGLGISAVAGFAYVAIWEIFGALTDHAFIDQYADAYLLSAKEKSATPEAFAAAAAEIEKMMEWYRKPWFRLPITFIEIFPVGALVSAFASAVLRRSDVLNDQ